MPSDSNLALLTRPLFSSRSRQEHQRLSKLSALFSSSKRTSTVTIVSIQNELDRALTDMAVHGYVLPPQESEIADELEKVEEDKCLPSDEEVGETKVTCEVPRVVKPLPKALNVGKGLFRKGT